MKRDTKGFTLVELLAAMVILGILVMFCVPTILSMLENNRNRVYVDDAKKMIAQAEYRIRANNSTIEKPSEGSAIVISLGYLESSDFDSPPNNGEYLKEASYVVVKNTGQKLEYSASIVEKMKKGGYKGVELTKNANLLKNDANKYVKVFTEDLCYVETTSTGGKTLTSGEINKYLGNGYCDEIEAVYNDIELSDDVVRKVDKPPKVKSLTMRSASNRDFNSLDALLILKAEDDYTSREDLKVYVSINSYDDALSGDGESYGSDNPVYTKSINFSDDEYGGYEKYEGAKIIVYVVVKDNAGNITKNKHEYSLHNNAEPIIDLRETKIYKMPTDKFAMPKATLKLSVSDDVDRREDLSICLKTEGECSGEDDFKDYEEYFGSGTTMTYDFGGIPNGDKKILYIGVRDTAGSLTTTDLKYEIYDNKPPTVNSISVTSSNNDLPASIREDKGDLTVNFSVDASDDFGDSNISFSVQDVTTNQPATEFQYTDCSTGTGTCSYKLGGNYDGGTRELKFIFKDQYGATVSMSKSYTVYKNQKPTVDVFVEPQKDACTNTSLCKDSNSTDAYVRVNVTDDIDYDYNDELKVCLSLNENDCEDTSSSNYKPYSEYINKFTSLTLSNRTNPYDGSTKKVYVSAVDSYGLSTNTVFDYKLYKNQEPTNVELNVESAIDDNFSYNAFNDSGYGPFNLKDVSVNFSADDDFGTDNLQVNICYKEASADNEKCTGYKEYSSYANLQYKLSLPEKKYLGQEYQFILNVKDSYGKVTTKTADYTLFKDLAPKIDLFEISSNDNHYHTAFTKYAYRVRDAFDTYSICIGARKNDTTSVTYAECSKNPYYIEDGFDGNDASVVEGTIDLSNFGWNYKDGTSKNIYLVVKDSYNHEKVIGDDYDLYKYCTDLSDEYEAEYELAPGEKEITAERCGGRCYQEVVNPNDSSDPKNVNFDIVAMYDGVLTYKDRHFSSHSCEVQKQIGRDCEYQTCYENGAGYYKAVGIRPVEDNWTHRHNFEDGILHHHDYSYPVYEVTYDAEWDLLKFTAIGRVCEEEKYKYTLEKGYVYTINYDEEEA